MHTLNPLFFVVFTYTVSIGVVCARVVDGPENMQYELIREPSSLLAWKDSDLLGASRVPTLASDKVAAPTSPVDAVGTTSTVGVSYLGSSISPP